MIDIPSSKKCKLNDILLSYEAKSAKKAKDSRLLCK